MRIEGVSKKGRDGRRSVKNRREVKWREWREWTVFRTVRGPHRDGGDNAKKTGRDGTVNRGPG